MTIRSPAGAALRGRHTTAKQQQIARKAWLWDKALTLIKEAERAREATLTPADLSAPSDTGSPTPKQTPRQTARQHTAGKKNAKGKGKRCQKCSKTAGVIRRKTPQNHHATEEIVAGKFEIKRAKDGQFYFNLKAQNGEILLTSNMYTAKASAHNDITSVMTNALLDQRFERTTSTHQKPYFILKATNGDPIGVSDMYASPAARDHGIQSVKRHAPEARVEDLSMETP